MIAGFCVESYDAGRMDRGKDLCAKQDLNNLCSVR